MKEFDVRARLEELKVSIDDVWAATSPVEVHNRIYEILEYLTDVKLGIPVTKEVITLIGVDKLKTLIETISNRMQNVTTEYSYGWRAACSTINKEVRSELSKDKDNPKKENTHEAY